MPTPGATEKDTMNMSMREAAYKSIEELLNTGTLRPGQLVTQRGLVELTGLTLGAVREAVPRLEAEGLLQTFPKRGLLVPSLDVSFVRDAYQMRRMIELAAIPDLLGRLDQHTLEEWIDRHCDALTWSSSDDLESLAQEFQSFDWSMHEQFVAAMQNALVENVYRVTAIKIRMAVQSRIKVTPGNIHRVAKEHLRILKALKQGDVAAAREALAFHLNNSLKLALGEQLTEVPFED